MGSQYSSIIKILLAVALIPLLKSNFQTALSQPEIFLSGLLD